MARALIILLLAGSLMLSPIFIAPASAHISASPTHLWSKHLKSFAKKLFYTKSQANSRFARKTTLSAPGTINRSTNPVAWTKLKGVPAGLADGADAITTNATLLTAGTLSALRLPADGYSGIYGKQIGLEDYCALAATEPRSYPAAPCESTGVVLDSTGDVGRSASLVIGVDANPVISYYDEGGNQDLKLIHCNTADCASADAPRTLDSAGNVGAHSSIAIGSDGFPIVSYWDLINGFLRIAHCSSVDCSTMDPPSTLDSLGDVGAFNAIAIGDDGFPVVSYREQTGVDTSVLKFIHCTAVDCSTKDAPRTLDPTGSTGLHISLAIGTDGKPVISYWNNAPSYGLRFVHCGNAGCSSGNASMTLDSSTLEGSHSSVAIGTDGFPVIGYARKTTTQSNLRFIHCRSLDCTSRDAIRVLDGAGSVGQDNSMAIGADGFPVISYYDGTSISNGNLKFLRCTKVDCSTADAARTLDASGDVGRDTAIALGADGYPVAAYRDVTNHDLRFIQVK